MIMFSVSLAAGFLLWSFPSLSFAMPSHAGIVSDINPTPKLVFAHFMVGNTYPYSEDDWFRDITLAASKGIDAFALNVGRDPWQPSRVASAYNAAGRYGTDFKLFMSFDMTSLSCGSAEDAVPLQQYIDSYKSHPNQLIYGSGSFVSTFSGEHCSFGTDNLNAAWSSVVKNGRSTHFVPAFFVDPGSLHSLSVIDGAFPWNSGWPMGDYDIGFDPDRAVISNLDGRTYMAAVSPWFFTHYGPNTYNKNFIYRADDWLLSERWELLNQNRDSVNLVEVLTWNDYGESHYIGPIQGAQPMSESWTNGFDHTGWLDLNMYYIEAFKRGQPPSITKDKIYMWSRLYPAAADADDSVGRPYNWEYSHDFIWAVVLLASPAEVKLTCGQSSSTTSLAAGLSKLKLPLTEDCQARALISRNGNPVLELNDPNFKFSTRPPSYNFNAFVASSG